MKLTQKKLIINLVLKSRIRLWCFHIFSLFPLLACYEWTHIMHITHKSYLYLNLKKKHYVFNQSICISLSKLREALWFPFIILKRTNCRWIKKREIMKKGKLRVNMPCQIQTNVKKMENCVYSWLLKKVCNASLPNDNYQNHQAYIQALVL